jgi:hypothetical protein
MNDYITPTAEKLIADKLLSNWFNNDKINYTTPKIVDIVDAAKENIISFLKCTLDASKLTLLKDMLDYNSEWTKNFVSAKCAKVSHIINDLLQITNIQDEWNSIRNALVQKYISTKISTIMNSIPIAKLVMMWNPEYIVSNAVNENYNESLMKIRRQLIQETQQYKGSKIEEKIQEYEILESCIPYLTQAGSETRKKIRNDDNVSIVLSEAISNLLVLNNYSNNHLQSCIVWLCNLMSYETLLHIINECNKKNGADIYISWLLWMMWNYNTASSIWKATPDEIINWINWLTWLFDFQIDSLKSSTVLDTLVPFSPNTWLWCLHQFDPNHTFLQQLDTWWKEQVISSNNIRFLLTLFCGHQSNNRWALDIYNIYDLYKTLGVEKIANILKEINVKDYSNFETYIDQYDTLKTRRKQPLSFWNILYILKKWTPESVAYFINHPSKLSYLRKISDKCEDNSINLIQYYNVTE